MVTNAYEYIARIRTNGNSQGINITKDALEDLEHLGIKVGDRIKVYIQPMPPIRKTSESEESIPHDSPFVLPHISQSFQDSRKVSDFKTDILKNVELVV